MKVLVTGLIRRHRETVIRLPTRGFTVLTGQAINRLSQLDHRPDVVLLECDTINEPVLEHCRRLRAACDAPIVAVTSRADTAAWMLGLTAGIDDFLMEPFGLDELAARLRIAVRPAPATVAENRSSHLTYGPLRIAQQSRTVTVHGTRVELRPKEYQLLVVLARRAGQALSREHLINCLWPSGWDGAERSLEVHVASLRAKLAVPGLIATVRGVGYRLISQESYLRLEGD